MMMLLILTSVLGYELKTAVGTSVFIMTFTALTGAVSHFAIGGARTGLCLPSASSLPCSGPVLRRSLPIRRTPRPLNRATGIVLVVLGIVVMGFNLLTK